MILYLRQGLSEHNHVGRGTYRARAEMTVELHKTKNESILTFNMVHFETVPTLFKEQLPVPSKFDSQLTFRNVV